MGSTAGASGRTAQGGAMSATTAEPIDETSVTAAVPPTVGAVALVVAQADDRDEPPLTVIEAAHGWQVVDVRELWRYRELMLFLAWRDVKVRYKQTALGVGWAVVQPLATMLVFALFLGRAGGLSAGVANYPLFVFAGMVAWTLFSNVLTSAANSILANERIVTKTYFPRLVLPLSAAGVGLFDHLIGCGLVLTLAVLWGIAPTPGLLAIPLVAGLLAAAAAGIGIGLAALMVVLRDVRFALPFTVQLWMFATPSIYMSADAFGENALALLPLNPAYGLTLNFRQAVLGGPLDWYALVVSGGVGLAALVIGAVCFRRVEKSIPDLI